jgi:hypothetical protein
LGLRTSLAEADALLVQLGVLRVDFTCRLEALQGEEVLVCGCVSICFAHVNDTLKIRTLSRVDFEPDVLSLDDAWAELEHRS